MFGKIDNPENQKLVDLNFREVMTLLPLTILAFWIGLYPAPFFKILDEPVQRLVQQVDKTYTYPQPVAQADPTAPGAGKLLAGALAPAGTPTVPGATP
jgi:NADH-quinone oxidoreductase subunit M